MDTKGFTRLVQNDEIGIVNHNGLELINLAYPAKLDFFNEKAYIEANPDVLEEMKEGRFESPSEHFLKIGQHQNRKLLFNFIDIVKKSKKRKLRKLSNILPETYRTNSKSFCVDTIGEQIIDDIPISSFNYNNDILDYILEYKGKIIVDLGAGYRLQYFLDVINIEIGNFITTDIRCYADSIPMADNSVDFLFSLALLEHVPDPFAVAKEIERILKPGGLLVLDTAFMQGLHGYPKHYYNMTFDGLINLFNNTKILQQTVMPYQHSTYSLFWIIKTFSNGLHGADYSDFLNLKMKDIINYSDPFYLLKAHPFLNNLDELVNKSIPAGIRIIGNKISE